jgi:hypothetical protein
MARLLITYSLSYDWLVQGRPEEDWRPMYERGLAYQAAMRTEWGSYEPAVFRAFEAFGLRFWEAWPAYPVHLPEDTPAFKDPLTFAINDDKDWDDMRSVLVHELCHLHEDHAANRARYEPALAHVEALFSEEDEAVRRHVVTCTLQRAVLMQAFADRWRDAMEPARRAAAHPVLKRTWDLIGARERQIDWSDHLRSLTALT